MRKTIASSALFFAVLMTMLVWPAPRAAAHAVLVETDPAGDTVVQRSPERVTATFSEPVEIAFGALRVYDTDGERVDTGVSEHPAGEAESVTSPLLPDLPAGTYTATYRVISADGHPVQAAFVFHVERPGEQPEGIGETLLSGTGGSGPAEQALYGVARWILFAGTMLLIGATCFLVFVWTRSGEALSVDDQVGRRFTARWRRLTVWGWGLALVGTVSGFFLQGAVAADVGIVRALSPSIGRELLGTRYGSVAAARIFLLLALAGIWAWGSRRSGMRSMWPLRETSTVGARSTERALSPVPTIASLILLAVLALTPGLSGHAGATEPEWLNVSADAAHVAFAGVWLGGLVTLLACAYKAVGEARASERTRILGPVVSRFSDLAMVSVAVLVVTGIYRSWVEVQAWRAFIEAPYGWVLLAKIGVFLPLLALGAVNNRLLKPRIARSIDSGGESEGGLGALRRTVSIEVVLGAVVLALTALLVNLSPARVDAGVTGPFVQDVALGDNNLNIVVDPNEIGENLVHLTVTTPEGSPAELQGMKVRFSMPAQDIGPLTGKGTQLGPGHFVVQGNQLSVPGEWTLQIEARIDRFTNAAAEVEVTVNG
jgi:copper transport protein